VGHDSAVLLTHKHDAHLVCWLALCSIVFTVVCLVSDFTVALTAAERNFFGRVLSAVCRGAVCFALGPWRLSIFVSLHFCDIPCLCCSIEHLCRGASISTVSLSEVWGSYREVMLLCADSVQR
jgi:hypothetical protein